MSRQFGGVVLFVLAAASALAAQPRNMPSRKQALASRVPPGAIRVDGRLDDEAWRRQRPIADFVQKEPIEGAPPAERMEVRFAYDDTALYIGARMYSGPATVHTPLGRRDNVIDQADHIIVSLDTYLDRRTAYDFGVTASGVRLDRYHAQDDESTFDDGYDPVWEAKATTDAQGWTAELWIPFSQLRFNEQPRQAWGLNVQRFTPALNEYDYWAPVPRTERAWASRFGELRGIEGVRPTKRMELLPYVATSSRVTGNHDRRNPFDNGANLASHVGADLKMGFGPNLTLDATVNPDFGQVEADPAEVNLTAFETRFTEKRPFFVEGARLLTIPHNSAFYSRRIGARPSGPASGDYVDYPAQSTILAAAKLTGRLPSRTSIGILSAITDEEFARTADVRDLPRVTTVRVAPRTLHALARVQQEFGPSTSSASLMVVGLHRDLDPTDPLAALMARNAFMAGGDALLRFKRGEYEVSSTALLSTVDGTTAALESVQRSSAHYMQRPDQHYNVLDPTRTSLGGFSATLNLTRTGGRHWLWSLRYRMDSPTFEPRDIGVLSAADGIQPSAELRYRETRPGKVLRSYSIGVEDMNEWNWGGARQKITLRPSVNVTWRNFWTTSFNVTTNARAQDWTLTRGGPLMEKPPNWTTTLNVANSPAAATRWSGRLIIGATAQGGLTRQMNGMLSFRPGHRWQLQVQPAYERVIDPQQYVATLGGGSPLTFGRRYVFAHIERSTFSMQYRLGYTLKPDVNLDVYAEPFAASGRYYDYGELAVPNTALQRRYGAGGTTVELLPDGARTITDAGARFTLKNRDFNVRSFRSNVVLRWEWRPGSTLYVVWQQSRYGSEPVGNRVGLGDVFNSITAPGSNIFLVKTSFWLPVK